MSEELKKISATPVELKIGEDTLQLRPARFGMWAQLVEIIAPVIRDMGKDDQAKGMMEIAITHGHRLIPMAALLTEKPKEWIEQLDADDAVALIGGLIQVNSDFFIRRMTPEILKILSQMLGKLGSSDLSPSPRAAATEAGPASSSP